MVISQLQANPTAVSVPLEQQLQTLFEAAHDEVFETGVESELSTRLVYIIKQQGESALDSIANIILSEKANSEAAWEALRWLGKMDDAPSHEARLLLLERCLLTSHSIGIKDGAVLGLASMDDPKAIPGLEKALEQETNSEFRPDIKQVLQQLKATKREQSL